jgi:DNA-binding NarL/FixJ family response regulator
VGFPFGVYRDSEHAWYCVTGVDGGYYYRRRPPLQLLEPISNLWQNSNPNRDLVESQIRHHVQTLFGVRSAAEDAFPGLTNREKDVLLGLRHGHTDKTLATKLGISSWTVHTHMKSLFDKLGVHTRAEAVAKFFEK